MILAKQATAALSAACDADEPEAELAFRVEAAVYWWKAFRMAKCPCTLAYVKVIDGSAVRSFEARRTALI